MEKKIRGIFVSIIAVLSFIPFINVHAYCYDLSLPEIPDLHVYEDGTITFDKTQFYDYYVSIKEHGNDEAYYATSIYQSIEGSSINLIDLMEEKCPGSYQYGCLDTITGTYDVLFRASSSKINSEFTITYEYGKLSGSIVESLSSNTVSFNSNGGSDVSSQIISNDSTAIKPTNPAKNGYVFGGWYKDEELINIFDFNTPINEDITLYAKWYRNLSGAKVSGIINKTYNGYYQKQNNIKVEVDEIKLYQGTDYKVTYKSNLNTGKATVIITGIGDYRGTITKTFKIIPSKPVVSVTSRTRNSLSFKWKKISTSTGYQIAFRQMGPNKYKYYNITTINKKFTGLKSKRYHQMKVRAYKIIDGKKVYGSWSNVKKVRTK